MIAEELKTHVCKDVIDYRIEDKILWLFDGEIWYPRKLLHLDQPQGNNTNNYRGGNSTLKQYSYKVLVPYYTVW
jgi:hypothetical protein